MMPIFRFLSSLRTLAKNGDITIRDAYKFAQQEFGEVSDLLKLQINKIFKDADAPSIRKPEGEVIEASFKPGRDKTGKVVEESESQRLGLAGLDNPYRMGGGLDPVEGMTRTAARVVLGRKGIKVPERGDPIDVFEENFGGDALMDLRQAGEELLEKEQMGRITESMGEFLESRGLFDLKVDKTLPKGITDEELLKKLMDEDPEEFAKGGRVGYDDGGITSLPKGLQKDTTTGEGANIFNMYAEKDDDNTFNMYAERPEKSLKENLEFVKEIKGGVSPSTTMYMFKMYLDEALKKGEITKEKYNKMLMPFFGKASEGVTRDFERYEENMANGGRVGYAFGSGVKLAKFLAIKGKTLKDEIKKAVDNFMQPSGDKKLDADMILDDMLEELGTSRSEIDQKDIIEAYGDVYNTLSKGDEISAMAPKMRERFELKEKYPGIDEELVAKIVDDPDPQRKAEVLATIEQAFELMKQGKSSDEVLDIMKQMTDRTKQAGGGLSYLSGF
jgi:hypothetical protein